VSYLYQFELVAIHIVNLHCHLVNCIFPILASSEQPKRENLASTAFREQYADFYSSISQPALPEKLATKLYSKAMITSGARDSVVSVTGPGVTPAYRALTLLQIVETAIASEYKNLRRFVRVVKREDVLRPLAEKLYHRYSKPFQCVYIA